MTDKMPISSDARKELDSYLAQAGSWANDRNDAQQKSQQIAWIIAGVAAFIAFCEAMALLMLTPLKTVVPYTLMVDKQTGYVQLLKPLEPQALSGDQALTQSFLVQYVVAREGFDINALQSDYRKVALWSSGPARSRYLASVQAANPESALAILPRSAIIQARVKSVSPLSDSTAMVRFDTVRSDAGGRVSAPQPWMAVIKYRYSGEPMRAEDRYVNPLGFQVIKYTRNPEALPPPAPPAPITEQEIGAQPESQSDTQLINPEAAAVTAPELGEHVIHRLRPAQ
jgi:type IV secretion system protein VirB8